MRRAISFYWECFKEAFTGSFSLANTWFGLWGPVLVWLLLKWWGYTMTLPEHLDAYAILVVLAFLGSTWIGTIIVRFFNAPVTAYDKKQCEINSLLSANRVLNERLRPRINIFLDPIHRGVIEVPTDISEPPNPPRREHSKWIQFSVSCATDVPLIDCEAFLTSVQRLNEHDNVIAQLVEEEVNCNWSQQSAAKITIPPLRIQRVNLFSIYPAPLLVRPETNPIKFKLNDAIQTPGRYRLNVLVAAKDAPPRTESFVFEWRDYQHVTLAP
jgi:hypothetical protein